MKTQELEHNPAIRQPMAGKWAIAGVPRKGWRCVDVIDLGPADGGDHKICEMCENRTIRYVHVMAHDDYPAELDCGCVCASHMENDYVKPKLRERQLKKREHRLQAMVILDPRLVEKNCTQHCSQLANEYDALFFHKDFASWNSQYSGVVRLLRAIFTWENGYQMSKVPWHGIMVLALSNAAAKQIANTFTVVYQYELDEEPLLDSLEYFREIQPRNGQDMAQENYEQFVRQQLGIR